MSDRRIPKILLLRWVDEMVKLVELTEVLYRSICYTRDKFGGETETRICMGDDELVRIIRDRLDSLFVEIEEVKDGHIEDKL